MKKFIVLLSLISINALTVAAQRLTYTAVKNQDLTYVLNNIEKMTSYTKDDRLAVRIYSISDPSGSAHLKDEEEAVTNSIYIAVSEYDESPEQHLYRLSSVFAPKFINWVKSPEGPKLIVTYGLHNKRRTATIAISLRKLTITEK